MRTFLFFFLFLSPPPRQTKRYSSKRTMKIFAKRKKQKGSEVSNGTSSSIAEPSSKTFASDPLVEELLKLDPSQWNAKQRRMIKRYQERKKEEEEHPSHQPTMTMDTASSSSSLMLMLTQQDPLQPRHSDLQPGKQELSSKNETMVVSNENCQIDNGTPGRTDFRTSNSDIKHKVNDQSENGKSSSLKDEDASSSDDENKDIEDPKEQMETESEEAKPYTSNLTVNGDTEEKEDSNAVGKDHPIWKLLDGLNSKMKRTLSRLLEREGAKALDDVREKAKNLMRKTAETSQSTKKDCDSHSEVNTPNEKNDSASSTARNKRKRKQQVDEDTLTPEERLRREEQRRLQREAAERRARGEDKSTGHRHSLNSERRRANRRKSKWKTAKRLDGNTHNISGFKVRKQAANAT